MNLMKGRTFWLLLVGMLLLLLGGCGKAANPVEIIQLNVFHIYNDEDTVGIYIKWRNISDDKIIDALTLSVCSDLDEEPFECQIFEPDGIMPGLYNNEHIFAINEYEAPLKDIKVLSIVISEVCFTDGSRWEANAQEQPVLAEVDGQKGEGEFPARLNSVFFYGEGRDSQTYESVKFQVDWTNISQTNSIIDVVYKIVVKSGDGNVICDEDGEDAIYVSDYFNPYVQVSSLSDYSEIKYLNGPTVSLLRENDAVLYELSICKVVNSQGIVWENHDPDSGIKVAVNGKKGFAFSNSCSNESIQELIERIAEEGGKQGLDLGLPDVFVQEQEYCVLRYADVDVRVELARDNEVSPYKVRFAVYSQPSDMDPEVWIQDLKEKMNPFRLCICAAVLTDLPYTEVIQKVGEYNQNNMESIEFNDTSYAFFEKSFLYNNEYGDTALYGMVAVGRGFYNDCQALGL